MALDRTAFVKHLKADIEWAEAYYADTVEPQLIERYEIYRASKERYRRLFPNLTARNKVELRSFDLWSTVEWMLPGLLRAFFGSDTILAVNGRGGEDAARAAKFEKLLSFENTVKNPGYRIFKDWFRDALSMNLGVLKCWWRREEKATVRDEVLSPEQFRMLEEDGANRILSVTPGPFATFESLRVKWENRSVLENCPEFETVRPSDIRFVPDARHLRDSSMVAHRKPVSIDHLRKEARKGLYDGAVVEEIAKTGEGWVPTALEKALDKAAESTATKLSEDKTPRRRVTIHECYCTYDLDGDGELEDAIATVCGDKLLRVVENPYGRHVFFDLVPFSDGYQIWSDLGLPEVVGDVQDANTAFFRQMVVALAQSNEGRAIVNEQSVQLQDLADNLQYVRATGPSNDWYRPLESPGMDPQTFRLYELFRGNLEQWTPQTRYNQGTDGSSLNKTATGINLIMTASQARQDEVIRNFAETGVSEFIRFEIQLNQRYMDQATHFRLANEFLEVTPDDLQGDFDLSINATTGVADRAAKNQVLREYLERLYPFAAQIGLATPEHFARAARRVLELNGIENAGEFITSPEEGAYVGPVGPDSGGAGGGVPVGAAGVFAGGGGADVVAAAGGGDAGGGVGAAL